MAERQNDEYKNVKFYADNTTTKQSGFSKFEVGRDFYFCRYIDGKIAMLSQAYTSIAGRDNGIESVKKNEKLGKRYVFEKRGGTKHGFALKAGNGHEIAISPDYAGLGQARAVSGRLTGSTKAKASLPKKVVPKKATPKKAAPKSEAAKPKAKKAAAPKPRTKRSEDEYLPLASYKKQTKGKQRGFESFKGENGEYYFTYFENGKIALISEGYPTAAIRDTGLASVQKNMKIEKRYVFGQDKGADGKEGFILRAGNHKEIAKSVGYGSAAGAAAGAAYLMGSRRRVAPKTPKPAAATPRAVKPKVVKAKVSKPKTAKPKAAPKKTKPSVVPLAAGSVAIAGLGAAAAAAKSNAVKKAAVPVKAAPIVPKPVAAPIAAAALGTAAVAGAAVMAAKPKAEPVAAAPIAAVSAAATPAAAGTTGGGGIWGWLKWLLFALLALLAILFLFKACASGGAEEAKGTPPVTTTDAAAVAPLVTCWNRSKAKDQSSCPAKITCWDNSFATNQTACPAKPAPPPPVAETPADEPTPTVSVGKTTSAPLPTPSAVAGRICAPSSNVLFNVSRPSPKSVNVLGTNPQFGNSLSLTPDQFYRKLVTAAQTNQSDRAFLNLLARDLGYGSFANMDASMFSNDTLAKGTSGLLGFGSQHALQFSALNLTDPTHLEAFRVRSANGTDVHFMKRCGNYMYVCQP